MMRRLLLIVLAAAACGDENRTQTGYTPSSDKTSTSTNDTTPRVAASVPGLPDTVMPVPAAHDSIAFAMRPLAATGPAGEARLLGAADHASFHVTLSRATPGAHYAGELRQGSCARMGALVSRLTAVSAGTDGAGGSWSDVSVPADLLRSAPHVVAFGEGATLSVCGEIPGRSAP
jgi:hypothetical protein